MIGQFRGALAQRLPPPSAGRARRISDHGWLDAVCRFPMRDHRPAAAFGIGMTRQVLFDGHGVPAERARQCDSPTIQSIWGSTLGDPDRARTRMQNACALSEEQANQESQGRTLRIAISEDLYTTDY